jgi:hypothetical protein
MIEPQNALKRSLVGSCGVFYVSAELSRRDWTAMPTIRNTRGIDIIASKGDCLVNIQVKTNSSKEPTWFMSESNEKSSYDLYYVFVTLKGQNDRPDFYIVPSKTVAEYISRTHKKLESLPPKRKRKKYAGETKEERQERLKKVPTRQFPNWIEKDFKIGDYKDNWKILERNSKEGGDR